MVPKNQNILQAFEDTLEACG